MNGSASNSQRVGEIFATAGNAFQTLGDLTKQLESSGSSTSKWTDQEINMLANAVNNFATELNVISGTIRARTVNQIKGTLKKKAFDEAGIKIETTQPPPKPTPTVTLVATPPAQPPPATVQPMETESTPTPPTESPAPPVEETIETASVPVSEPSAPQPTSETETTTEVSNSEPAINADSNPEESEQVDVETSEVVEETVVTE